MNYRFSYLPSDEGQFDVKSTTDGNCAVRSSTIRVDFDVGFMFSAVRGYGTMTTEGLELDNIPGLTEYPLQHGWNDSDSGDSSFSFVQNYGNMRIGTPGKLFAPPIGYLLDRGKLLTATFNHPYFYEKFAPTRFLRLEVRTAW